MNMRANQDVKGGWPVWALILLASVLLYAQVAAAAEYYVSNSGQDTFSGLKGAPWKTLQHAVDYARPGDTIRVESGAYRGFRATVSGTEKAWITVKPAEGAGVVLNQAGPNNEERAVVELGGYSGGVAYWRLEGLTIAGGPSYGLRVAGTAEDHAHHIALVESQVYGAQRTGVYFEFVDDALIENNRVYGNGYGGIHVKADSDSPVIRGNYVYGNAAAGIQLNGAASFGGDGVVNTALITKNTIYRNGSSGSGGAIGLDGVTGSRITHNYIYDNYSQGISIFHIDGAQGTTNNTFSDNRVIMPAGSGWAVRVVNLGCTGNRFYYNTLYSAERGSGAISLPSVGLFRTVSDYNQVADRFSLDGGASVISLDAWQAAGFDANSSLLTDAGRNRDRADR